MLKCNQLIGFGAGGGFRANAVDYDSSSYLTRTTAFSGAPSASAQCIFSAWFRRDALQAAGNANICSLFNAGASVRYNFFINPAHSIDIHCQNTTSNQYRINSASTFTTLGTWYHVLASVQHNLATGSRVSHLYIDSISDKTVIINSGSAFTVDASTFTDNSVGSHSLPASQSFDGALAELYVAPGQFLDFSIASNREKFIKDGRPVNLGSDGSDPTGAAPLIYLPNQAATINVNAGTGGNFTINGSPVDASTSPSD